MAHLSFICHSSRDSKIAKQVVEKLEKAEIPCWIAPRDIPPGLTYAASIIKGIKNSKFFIFIYSDSSNNSDAVINEIENANSQKMHIIPFKVDNLTYNDSLEYYLKSKQAIEAYNKSLDEAVGELIRYIHSIIKDNADWRASGGSLPGGNGTGEVTSNLKYVLIAAGIIIVLTVLIISFNKCQNNTNGGGYKPPITDSINDTAGHNTISVTGGQVTKGGKADQEAKGGIASKEIKGVTTSPEIIDQAIDKIDKDATASSKIYSQGRLTIVGSYSYDLDLGTVINNLYDIKNEIFYECKTDVEKYFDPMSGAYYLLGHRDFNSIQAAELINLPYSKEKINASNNQSNQLIAGSVVAVKTNEGRYSKFLIDTYGTGQWKSDIEISWVTYELVKSKSKK